MRTDMLTTVQASALSGYHRVHLRRLVKTGKVKGEKIGRDWFIDRKSLMAYVRKAAKMGAKRGPKPGT